VTTGDRPQRAPTPCGALEGLELPCVCTCRLSCVQDGTLALTNSMQACNSSGQLTCALAFKVQAICGAEVATRMRHQVACELSMCDRIAKYVRMSTYVNVNHSRRVVCVCNQCACTTAHAHQCLTHTHTHMVHVHAQSINTNASVVHRSVRSRTPHGNLFDRRPPCCC